MSDRQGNARYHRLMSKFREWMRSVWRRVMSAERGASDDLPEHHAGPAPSDLQRTLPPGGAGRL
jgi:hypothetical protein